MCSAVCSNNCAPTIVHQQGRQHCFSSAATLSSAQQGADATILRSNEQNWGQPRKIGQKWGLRRKKQEKRGVLNVNKKIYLLTSPKHMNERKSILQKEKRICSFTPGFRRGEGLSPLLLIPRELQGATNYSLIKLALGHLTFFLRMRHLVKPYSIPREMQKKAINCVQLPLIAMPSTLLPPGTGFASVRISLNGNFAPWTI